MYYSKTTAGFYDPEINKEIPADAVEISDTEHKAMLDGQTAGMLIAPDASGKPALMPKPPKTSIELEDDASAITKAKLAQLRADIFPDMLAFLVTLPGAPQSLKDAALVAATEKAKIKP